MTVRHFYLRDYTQSNKHPIGCMAVEVNRGANEIRYAISTCSPLDKFNAAIARDKATGRLAAMPCVIVGEVPKAGHEITKCIMEHIISQNEKQRGKLPEDEARDWRKHRSALAYWAARGWLDSSVKRKAAETVAVTA